jgi:hypothetical protein
VLTIRGVGLTGRRADDAAAEPVEAP